MATYTIGQVAERSGFSTSALRYYEQHGLLDPVARTEAGYRLYDDTSLARLEFIDRAKQLGCTLEEIADLAELWEAEECGPVQARLHSLVTARIADAQRRSAELVRFTAQLQATAAHLGGDPVDGPCGDGCACVTSPRGAPDAAASPVALGDPADRTVACTLAGADVPGRMEDWRQVLENVTDRAPTPDGGLRLALSPAVQLDELTRLAAAEQGCCTFFAFAVTIDHRGIALEVRAPTGAADVVTAVFGAAA
jgi:DNA-binding transcriptional MerR regulator